MTPPAFLPPPLISATVTTLLVYAVSPPSYLNVAPPAASYMVGVLGSLIGADLMHLGGEVIDMAPAIIDIGGGWEPLTVFTYRGGS